MSTRTRLVAALAGAGLMASALAGCGGGPSGGGGEGGTLNVLFAANAQFPTEQQEWFKTTSATFKAQTGSDVTFETFATANDELTKIQTSVVSGQGPDVYGLGTTFTPTAYSTGAFVKLDDAAWSTIGGKEKFVPSSLGISGPDAGNQIGIPFVSRPFVMVYNKDLLKKAGIDKPATSWDELEDQAKKLTTGDQHGIATAYKDNFDPWKLIWGMATQAGNPLIDGKTVKIDDPAVKKAYETYFGWLTKDKVVDPAAVGWSNTQALASFAEGKTGYFLFTSTLASITLDKSPVAGRYAYALMPTIPPGATSRPAGGLDAASILSGDNLVVADYSKKQDLAFQFVKMITDKDAQLEYYKIFGNLPVNAEAASSLTSDPNLKVAAEALDKSVATPFSGGWGDVQLALTNVVVQSIPGLAQGSVSDADLAARLADAQKAGQSAVDRAK